MSRENGLLSIGELSTLTGASLRSLRYYEKIGLLTPAYVDPNSSYRYYSFDQAYYVEIIMFCVELDIPLKELTRFSDANDMMDFRAFLAHGKAIAEQKMKKIKKGLQLIRDLGQKMDLSEQHPFEQIYKRDVETKYIFTKPCGSSLKDVNLFELFTSFSDIGDVGDSSEYGFLSEYSLTGILYFAFIEVPKRIANKTIHAGTYLCRQSDEPQIEKVRELFKGQLANKESFLAMESEIFVGKHKINKPLHEVRVIWM